MRAIYDISISGFRFERPDHDRATMRLHALSTSGPKGVEFLLVRGRKTLQLSF
jgi:hypothetical protein